MQVEGLVPVVDHADCGLAPGEPVEHAITAGGTDAGAEFGVIEHRDDRGGECAGIVGRNRECGAAGRTGHLRQRSTGGGDEGRATGHALDCRKGKAFVQRGDHRDLALGVELDDAFRRDAGDELHVRTESELVQQRGDLRAVFGLADHYEVNVVAFGAHLRHRFEQRHESLQWLI